MPTGMLRSLSQHEKTLSTHRRTEKKRKYNVPQLDGIVVTQQHWTRLRKREEKEVFRTTQPINSFKVVGHINYGRAIATRHKDHSSHCSSNRSIPGGRAAASESRW